MFRRFGTCSKKVDAAQVALTSAEAEVQAASAVVDQVTAECRRLQSQITMDNGPDGRSRFQIVSASLREVLAEMQCSPVVPPDVVQSAKQARGVLFSQITAVAAEAAQVSATTGARATESCTKRGNSATPRSPMKTQAVEGGTGSNGKEIARRLTGKHIEETPVPEGTNVAMNSEEMPCEIDVETVPCLLARG